MGSSERERYYSEELNAYYFNRNRACFENILTFYQTGREYGLPDDVCLDLYQEERDFFRIPDAEIEPSPIKDRLQGGLLAYCSPEVERQGRMLYKTVMDPRYSTLASFWHLMDVIFIFVSISFMIFETDPTVGHHFVYGSTDHEPFMIGTVPINNIVFGMNVLVIMFFTIDIIIRFITWPGFLTFWKNIFNILDILSILPFYISVVAHSMHTDGEEVGEDHDEGVKQKYFILKMCRIFRIVRVFKFVKHSRDLVVIVKVLLSSKKELGLLVILLGISTITFGSIMFYIESGVPNTKFNSIMNGCWWAIVTITTLGYGDIYPTTIGGKILGSILLTFGMVFLTLPMTIIVSKFGTVYDVEKRNLDTNYRYEIDQQNSNSNDFSST